MSDSVRPHRRQPTRLPHPRDSPGKNSGVGCDFILQCVKVKSESEVAQLCLTLCNLMDCSLPGSSVHGISQARISKRLSYKNSIFSRIFKTFSELSLAKQNKTKPWWVQDHNGLFHQPGLTNNIIDCRCI